MNEPIPYTSAGDNWLPLALLEIPADDEVVERMATWLTDALGPLSLPADFSAKLLASVRDSAASISEAALHVRLMVFISAPHPDNGQAWGFFRMVRNEEAPASSTASTQVIAFYLYVESAAISG